MTITFPDSYHSLCASTLDRALSDASFYRRWRSLDPGPTRTLDERFAALPVLSRRDVRAHVPDGFMWANRSAGSALASGEVEIVTTSGTADERLSVVWHQPWWDRSERAAALLHPTLSRLFGSAHREAVLTSPVCAGVVCHVGDAPMAERILGDLLFLNQSTDPTAWGQAAVRRMADELRLFTPEVIEADPGYLAIFSRLGLDAGLALHQPACIVLTYELPSRMHYRWIGRAFPGVPIVSSYGSTETGHVLTQCQEGTFHQNTATCRVDIQPLRADRGGAGLGRLLVTTLGNPWFSLIRFDIGDIVRPRVGASCPCGRTEGFAASAIEGRLRDLTFDQDGGMVTAKMLDDALGAVEALTGYQVVQARPRALRARIEAVQGREGAAAEAIHPILRELYGADTHIEVRCEPAIPPEQSGKFRLARSMLVPEVEELLA